MNATRRFLTASVLALLVLTAPALGEGVDLLAGATWSYSGDGGKTFALSAPPAGAGKTVAARAEFTVKDPLVHAGLWAMPGTALKDGNVVSINGKPAPKMLEGMDYADVMPLDPQGLLAVGINTVTFSAVPPRGGEAPGKLIAYPAQLAEFQRGPIVGAVEPGNAGITCQTNMPAEVTVAVRTAEGKNLSAASPRGYLHRLKVDLPAGTKTFAYTLTLKTGGFTASKGPFGVRVPGGGHGAFRFAAAGDCRSFPDGWQRVSVGIARSRPELLLFSGDMVRDGRIDSAWDTEFCLPAKPMLATMPFYGAPGNHEFQAPLYYALMHAPGKDPKARHWSQAVAGVLFIGIDGEDKWDKDSPNVKWLEGVLKESREKYIFLMTHYPAWSSGTHGGRNELPGQWSRNVIMPLLAKYKASAMIAGHDHDYERSEPPADKGVTCIVSGGAGAPLYKKTGRGAAGNPYSKVYANVLHHCIFEVLDGGCRMKVLDVDGKLIDETVFEPRK